MLFKIAFHLNTMSLRKLIFYVEKKEHSQFDQNE